MKKINIVVPILLLAFISLSSCDRINCNREFTVVNTSKDSLIVATLIKNVNGGCNLAYFFGVSKKWYKTSPSSRTCLENEYSNQNLEFYIVNPSKFNDQVVFYSCDSIEEKNTILKKYSITIGELESNDFKVYYP
jgi:hypothetical protein